MEGTAKKYGSKQVTGYSEYWKANNIYDFAGNCWEWSQEAIRIINRTHRGGVYGQDGLSEPASIRSYSWASYSNGSDLGSRPTLIIK